MFIVKMDEVTKIIFKHVPHHNFVESYSQQRWIEVIVTVYTRDEKHLSEWLAHDLGKWFHRCGLPEPAKNGSYPAICDDIASDLQTCREDPRGSWLNVWLNK